MTSRNLLSRRAWIAAALTIIALGLVVHRYGLGLSSEAHDVAGDALWAMMIFAWLGALRPMASLTVRGGAALAICWAVEISQLYHTPSLDALRQTTIGQLVLGTDFDARDLAAYALGVLAATALEALARRRQD